jgi:hypothetical protein
VHMSYWACLFKSDFVGGERRASRRCWRLLTGSWLNKRGRSRSSYCLHRRKIRWVMTRRRDQMLKTWRDLSPRILVEKTV